MNLQEMWVTTVDCSPGNLTGNDGYRYGFNGAEKIDELSGEFNAYDLGARIYDSRIGRFLTIDRYFKEFEYESNYSFAGDNPILFIDFKGDKKTIYYEVIYNDGSKVVFSVEIEDEYWFEESNPNGSFSHGSDAYYVGYDYSVTITYDYRTNKKTKSEPIVDRTKVQITRTFNERIIKWMKDIIKSDENKKNYVLTGITFTIKDGGGKGSESKVSFGPTPDVIDITSLLMLLGNVSNGEAMGDNITDIIGWIKSAYLTGENIGQTIQELKDKFKKTHVQCNSCREIKSLENGTVEPDSTKIPKNRIKLLGAKDYHDLIIPQKKKP